MAKVSSQQSKDQHIARHVEQHHEDLKIYFDVLINKLLNLTKSFHFITKSYYSFYFLEIACIDILSYIRNQI